MGNKKSERKLDVQAWMRDHAFVRCKVCVHKSASATVREIVAECQRIGSKFPITATLGLLDELHGVQISKESLRKHIVTCCKRGDRG